MKVSVSLLSDQGDEYRISLASAEDGRLSDSMRMVLYENRIEIVEVILERVKGAGLTNNATLSKIACVIADLFMDNENMVVFFYCDDMGEIPNIRKSRHKDMLPQEYRSQLFTAMFNRYMTIHNAVGIVNFPMQIGDGRYKSFIHFIARERHRKYVELIKEDVIEGYGK